jgi:hypothetical protein
MSNGPIQTERGKAFAGKPPEQGELGAAQAPTRTVAERRKEEPFVLIENTTAKLHGIGLPPPGQARTEDGKAKEFTGIVAVDPKVKLLPGINKVNPQDWEDAKSQRMVQASIKAGVFREHLDAKSLSEIPQSDANRLIPGTFDRKLLQEWKDTDEREEVQKLIAAQFDLLKRQHRDVAADGSSLT